jgi:phosphoglycerate dehydrogenase-like enzyme
MLGFPKIAVHNLHYNALPVAEHAIALLLAAAKVIVPMDRSLRAGDWSPRYQRQPSLMLAGRTALVLGYGAVGQQMGKLCQGLGMNVIAIRRHMESAERVGKDSISCAAIERLHSLLPETDILLVCLPHTPETTGLIGVQELALLPSHAILINVARGPIVDEGALYQALHAGTLFAAGLDVWYSYPGDEAARTHTPPSAYPFHELENVVMSPHRAGHALGSELLRMDCLAKLLNTAERGDPMPNRVNLQAGY